MSARADRERRLAHDVGTPTLAQHLAAEITETEVRRARISGQTPAWALEPRT